MNLRTFGQNLGQVVAERTLDLMRSTNADDVRRVMHGQMPRPNSSAGTSMMGSIALGVGLFTLGAAIGAGVTALYAPTSGRDLRKRLGKNARDAQKQAMEMGSDVRHRLDDARTSIAEELDSMSAPQKTARKSSKSNGAARTRTRKAASMTDGRAEA